MGMNNKNDYEVEWAGSTTSGVIDLYSKGAPMAIVTPASFGATAITFEAATSANGTFAPVNKEDGTAISVTVSDTAAGWADLTNIFPASVRYVKLVAGSSITQTATLVTRDAA